jgi:transglycosylase-like protein
VPGDEGGPRAAVLERIAACESGGDPTAVSADGHYRGKYQFDRATWRSLGGSGDPAAAPEAEQDARAARLHASQGASPWPACG